MEIVLNIPERSVPQVLAFLADMSQGGGSAAGVLNPAGGLPAAHRCAAGRAFAGPADPEAAARVFFRRVVLRGGLDADSASVEGVAEILAGLAHEGRHAWLKAFPNGDVFITRGVIDEMRRALGFRAPGSISALARMMEGKGRFESHKLRGASIRGIRLTARGLAEWMMPERLERDGEARSRTLQPMHASFCPPGHI